MSQSNLTLPTRTEAEARAERAKHTPGPWIATTVTRGNHYIDDANGKEIAHIARREDLSQSANARLIAAAPDLLAALKTSEHRITQLCEMINVLSGNSKKARPEDFADVARAAIVKAEGV